MIYYFVIVAWVFYYFYLSFWPNLAWGRCDHYFNSEYCYDVYHDLRVCAVGNNGGVLDRHWFNQACRTITEICGTIRQGYTPINGTHCTNVTTGLAVTLNEVVPRVLSAEEFF
jgi:hypothetical protein